MAAVKDKRDPLRAWLIQARQVLDDGAFTVDTPTLERLRQARQAALKRVPAAANHRTYRAQRWLVILFACLILVPIWFLRPATHDVRQNLEDVELLSDEESQEFYENLEFIRWMNQGARSGDKAQ